MNTHFTGYGAQTCIYLIISEHLRLEEKVYWIKSTLFTFFYTLFWNVFSSNTNSQLRWKRGHKQKQIFMRDIHCWCPTLTKTGLCRQILRKHCDFQFSKNQLGGCWVVACRKGKGGQTRWRQKAYFCKRSFPKGRKSTSFKIRALTE